MNRCSLALLLFVLMLGFAACDTAGEDPAPAPSGTLDPNVAPVTDGDWVRPPADITWQWQLDGEINTAYDVDLYDTDLWETPDATIRQFRDEGRIVICYFSAGSGDEDRPDYDRFQPADLGRTLDGFDSERWLDVRSANVFAIMLVRLDLAVARGCDGVEPDNVDGYTNDPGFDFTATDQLAFNRNLANAAHERGLAIFLKNGGDQAAELVAYYDGELNEECHQFEECEQLRPFTQAGKPVLNVEYVANRAAGEVLAQTVCPAANAAGLRTLILPENLDDAFRVSCF